MFKKICSLTLFSLLTISSFLAAEIEYDIQDIGTLQTTSSVAIDLNNRGQILGWYNVDGSSTGKYFFVRNSDGSFLTIPSQAGMEVNWRFMTEDGKVYGTNDANPNFTVLFMWDKNNGVINLGNMPGREVMGVNNKGQVLIKSVSEIKDGKSIQFPVIWQNGLVKKLGGVIGNLGIASEKSLGLCINNNGDVVGESVVNVVYKNNEYKKLKHAALWRNGNAEDLHYLLPKSEETTALLINDRGDILFSVNNSPFLNNNKGIYFHWWPKTINNNGIFCSDYIVFSETKKNKANTDDLTHQVQAKGDSLWTIVTQFIKINDNGEIIAQGRTIYGEQHAMLLIPKKTQ